MTRSIKINDWLWIDDADVDLSFIRSSGPGGQNVNRVESAVQLRFKATQSRDLPPWVLYRLREIAGQRLNNLGEVVITSRIHRTQGANKSEALARLKTLLNEATHRKTSRILTKPSLGSRRRRLDGKKHRASQKTDRAKPFVE